MDDRQLALEHTLIQPFMGETFDSEVFTRAVGPHREKPGLTLLERNLDVIIPVHAIPKGCDLGCSRPGSSKLANGKPRRGSARGLFVSAEGFHIVSDVVEFVAVRSLQKPQNATACYRCASRAETRHCK